MRELLFALIGVGIIAPYTAFVPWLWQHGLDAQLFVEQMFANRIAAFFALDVIVSAIILIAAAAYSHRKGGRGLPGVIVATLLQATIFADQSTGIWIDFVKYGIFFAGAIVNSLLCYWLTRCRQANPLLAPALFAAPSLLVSAPTVALMWYGGGAFGGLIGSGRRRSARWIALIVFSLLTINSAYRIYAAANAPAHVTIGGGVVGNAAMALVFAILAVAPWVILRKKT